MYVVSPHGFQTARVDNGFPEGEVGPVDDCLGDGDTAFWENIIVGGGESNRFKQILALELDAMSLVGADQPVVRIRRGLVQSRIC